MLYFLFVRRLVCPCDLNVCTAQQTSGRMSEAGEEGGGCISQLTLFRIAHCSAGEEMAFFSPASLGRTVAANCSVGEIHFLDVHLVSGPHLFPINFPFEMWSPFDMVATPATGLTRKRSKINPK